MAYGFTSRAARRKINLCSCGAENDLLVKPGAASGVARWIGNGVAAVA
jgi:hypothetical protein